MARHIIAGALAAMALLSPGCSGSRGALQAIPDAQRIPLSIASLVDLTGLSSTLPPLDSLLAISLARGIVEVDEPTHSDNFARTAYQNPFRPARSKDSAGFTLRGDLEMAEYQKYLDVEAMIDRYDALGPMLAKLLDSHRGDMAAVVQYRLRLHNSAGACVDSFLIVGADAAQPEKATRKQLLANATRSAVCILTSQLVLQTSRSGILSVRSAPAKQGGEGPLPSCIKMLR